MVRSMGQEGSLVTGLQGSLALARSSRGEVGGFRRLIWLVGGFRRSRGGAGGFRRSRDLWPAMENRREFARKGFEARRGERR